MNLFGISFILYFLKLSYGSIIFLSCAFFSHQVPIYDFSTHSRMTKQVCKNSVCSSITTLASITILKVSRTFLLLMILNYFYEMVDWRKCLKLYFFCQDDYRGSNHRYRSGIFIQPELSFFWDISLDGVILLLKFLKYQRLVWVYDSINIYRKGWTQHAIYLIIYQFF